MSVSGFLEALARASLQGALFIAAVWIVCRLFPRLPASVRCGLWWAACLKLLVGLVWISPVRVPLLPADSGTLYIRNVVAEGTAAPARTLTPDSSPVSSRPPSPGEGKELWISGLAAIWLAGLLLVAARSVRQLRHTRWVIRRSQPVREGWIRAAFAELCGRLGLRRLPELLGSADVKTPQALGMLRPRVVLPRSGLERLSPPEITMTLCHELLHLRRGDLWLGWVPALAQRIFFFHPLAALAAREYAIAREAACDAEVLHVLGTAPQAYGRLLLRWGVAPRETGLAAAGASPSLQNLKRRLQMLQQTSEDKRRLSGWWWLAGAAVLAGLIPLQIVAQEQAPEPPEAEMASAPEAPEAIVAPEPSVAAAPAVAPAPPVPAVTPPPAAPPAPPAMAAPAPMPTPALAPALPPPSGSIPGGVEGGIPGGVAGGVRGGVAGGVAGGVPGGISGGVKGGVHGGVVGAVPAPPATPRALSPAPPAHPAAPPRTTPRPGVAPRPAASMAWAPTPAPAPAAVPGRVSKQPPPPPAPPKPPKPSAPPKKSGYWYRTGDSESWVLLHGNGSSTMSGSTDDIREAKRLRGDSKGEILYFRRNGKAYVVHDAATLAQAAKLWEPIGELGRRQGELGAQQGKLGAKQGELGAKQGELGAKQGALSAERARRGYDADDEDLENLERDIADRQKELARLQGELARQQEELGRQQEALGRRQEELGRQQEAASRKAEAQMRELMDRAIRSGVAQEVK